MNNERNVYLYFKGSVLIKGFISLGEIVVGAVLLFIPSQKLVYLGDLVVASGLVGSSGGSLAIRVGDAAAMLSTIGTLFIGIYLLSRGGVKLALIVAMLKNIVWAYPWSLGVLGVFVAYQIVELFKTHSLAILAITLFDFVVMYFIWKEWGVVRKNSQ